MSINFFFILHFVRFMWRHPTSANVLLMLFTLSDTGGVQQGEGGGRTAGWTPQK